jgi:mRNA interferase MazF
MKRGDLAAAVLPGAYGKPRPVLVIQSDLFDDLYSVTVLPLTSRILDASTFRLTIEPTPDNGLEERSQIIVDKAHTLPREKIGYVFGRLSESELSAVDRALAVFFGLS